MMRIPVIVLSAVAAAGLLLSSYARGAGARPPRKPTGSGSEAVERGEGARGHAPGKNLLPNGDFEKPSRDRTHPARWQQVDNLVFFWSRDAAAPERGRVMRIDTDVYQRQAYQWWVDLFVRGKPLAQAPSKEATSGPKYDTIGGLDGGFYWSDFIEIKKDAAYKAYVDAKGPKSYVFIRGYEKKLPVSFGDEAPAVQEQFRRARGERLTDANGRPIKYRLRYIYTTKFTAGGTGEWKTYTHTKPRHPTSREITENVRYLRVCLYPYWPAGEYWYDNVVIVEVPPDPGQAKPPAGEADIEEGKVVR